jgi:tetratricopeptide (TPR) repeat protein
MLRDWSMTWSAKKTLEMGRHSEVIKALSGRRPKSLTSEEKCALIGSHSFIGNREEAFELWNLYASELTPNQKIEAQFYLGIAATRASRFKLARRLFKECLQGTNEQSPSPFASQGMGFYMYYTGRFSVAKILAKRALQASLRENNTYVKIFATDLLGHCLVQMGRRSEGIRFLKRAKEQAEAHGNMTLTAAFASSTLLYEAEAGWRPLAIVSELKESIERFKTEDTYTRTNLVLELARQLTLRGQWNEAKSLLNREASTIYSFGNRRQELLLQLRLAEISFHQGDTFAVDHFLQSARRCLNYIADKAFEIRVLGLELKSKSSAKNVNFESNKKSLQLLSSKYVSTINQQILFRNGWHKDPKTPPVEDPIHHLLLIGKENPKQVSNQLLSLGYLGIWVRQMSIPPGTNFFVVLEDGSSIVAGSANEVVFRKKFLSTQNLRILQAIRKGHSSKAALIGAVWKYKYDPLRHDSLLYTAIAKLRKTLLPFDWIKTNEDSWQLDSQVEWQLPKFSATAPPPVEPDNWDSRLNFRQANAMEKPPDSGVWSISLYRKCFGVSTMTAYRDLTHLHTLKLLLRSGRGRATRYHLTRSIK